MQEHLGSVHELPARDGNEKEKRTGGGDESGATAVESRGGVSSGYFLSGFQQLNSDLPECDF